MHMNVPLTHLKILFTLPLVKVTILTGSPEPNFPVNYKRAYCILAQHTSVHVTIIIVQTIAVAIDFDHMYSITQ